MELTLEGSDTFVSVLTKFLVCWTKPGYRRSSVFGNNFASRLLSLFIFLLFQSMKSVCMVLILFIKK